MQVQNSQKFKCKAKCPICCGTSASYYCAECVRNGNFYHSSMKFPERFAEKRLRERRLRAHIGSLEREAPFQVACHSKGEILEKEIEDIQYRIALKKKVIQAEKRKIQKATQETAFLRTQIAEMRLNGPLFRTKNANMRENLNLYSKRIPQKKEQVEELQFQFKAIVKEKIHALTAHIFPILEIATAEVTPSKNTFKPDHQTELQNVNKQDDEEDDDEDDETIRGLTDALQTIYVRGKWIRTSHFLPEKNYAILSCVLPGSGNYASFNRPNIGPEVSEKKEAQHICAGLTYLCQLVNLLATLLNVYLPNNLRFDKFSVFSKQDMLGKEFERLLTKLNANMTYLCVSQGVSPTSIHPLRAMPNLMALLTDERVDLGRCGGIEFPESIIESLEAAGCYDDGTDSDGEEEWETVNHVPLSDFPVLPSGGDYYRLRRSSIEEGASGIVSSVFSMFRGMGNP